MYFLITYFVLVPALSGGPDLIYPLGAERASFSSQEACERWAGQEAPKKRPATHPAARIGFQCKAQPTQALI